MLYDAVVFDLDGTLTNSFDGISNCVAYALEKMGHPVPEKKDLRKFCGPPLVYSFQTFCGMSEEDAVQATAIYRERYLPVGWMENSVYGGIRSLLKALKDSGAHLFVATGKPQEPSERILEHFGLRQYFDGVAGPTYQDKSADKAVLIPRAMQGYDCKKVVMIGDAVTDVTGGQRFGSDTIAVGYGFGVREDLKAANPTYFAETVEDLSRYLLGSVPVTRGYFISMEGLDGCGKTTQMNAVERALLDRGYEVCRSREPGGCPISEKIRDLLLDVNNTGMCDMTEVILYAASRAQHVREVILPAMNKGQIVLCDRFVDSSVAFQGGGRQLGVDLIQRINEPALNGVKPDTTIYLHLDHETALGRRTAASEPDRIESEKASFHARVEAAYDALVAQDPERFITVDARKAPEDMTKDILDALFARMKEAGVA